MGEFMKRVLQPVIFIVAALYFAVDELFSGIARPIANWLSRLSMLRSVRDWIAGLDPYPALLLFVVPLLILEPAKPLATYLIATGHVVGGVVAFAIAELLKVVMVERLFDLNRDKLLSIPAFAWCYVRFRMIFAWLQSFEIWQATRRRVAQVKRAVRLMLQGWKRKRMRYQG
jgi:hypothetical protein